MLYSTLTNEPLASTAALSLLFFFSFPHINIPRNRFPPRFQTMENTVAILAQLLLQLNAYGMLHDVLVENRSLCATPAPYVSP